MIAELIPQYQHKIREQYSANPFPKVLVEAEPLATGEFLYWHSLFNAYYLRNKKFVDTQDKLILDAGCGTGYKALSLAVANPGARIVGVDISEESISLAKERLIHHGHKNFEFHVLAIEDAGELGLKFDYINCDDVAYLFPSFENSLNCFKPLLTTEGILRINYHSYFQRLPYLRVQNLAKLAGLMDKNPDNAEIETLSEIMENLDNTVDIKSAAWQEDRSAIKEVALMNYLIQGDKGCTVNEVFQFLENCGLEFISMVNWHQWDILSLFKDPEALPSDVKEKFFDGSLQKHLYLYELLNPTHRLIDFWCGVKGQGWPSKPAEKWSKYDWRDCKIYIQPQLKTPQMQEMFLRSIEQSTPLELNAELKNPQQSMFIDSATAAWIYHLWDGEKTFNEAVGLWLKFHPFNPLDFEQTTPKQAVDTVIETLIGMESLGYILLAQSPIKLLAAS